MNAANVVLPLLVGAGALLVVGVGAVIWQHGRYLRARRRLVKDLQPLFHDDSVFHVFTLGVLAPGDDLLAATGCLTSAVAGAGGRVVYAGKCLVTSIRSRQLPELDWDLVVLAQYPSRDAYERARKSAALLEARSRFSESIDQGMQRRARLNLLIPVMLLWRRISDVARRVPARYPFEPASALPDIAGVDVARHDLLVEALRKETELGRDAVVVLNFIRRGTADQQARDSEYGRQLMGLMAERAHGPMHMGRAVTVEGDAQFHSANLVYYPGVEFFAEMATSTFFGGIVGGKQLGDTLSIPTAPILDRLPVESSRQLPET